MINIDGALAVPRGETRTDSRRARIATSHVVRHQSRQAFGVSRGTPFFVTSHAPCPCVCVRARRLAKKGVATARRLVRR